MKSKRDPNSGALVFSRSPAEQKRKEKDILINTVEKTVNELEKIVLSLEKKLKTLQTKYRALNKTVETMKKE